MLLLGTSLSVSKLQFVSVRWLVVLPIIGPAVTDTYVVLVLVVFNVHQDGQCLPYLDDLADGGCLQ